MTIYTDHFFEITQHFYEVRLKQNDPILWTNTGGVHINMQWVVYISTVYLTHVKIFLFLMIQHLWYFLSTGSEQCIFQQYILNHLKFLNLN